MARLVDCKYNISASCQFDEVCILHFLIVIVTVAGNYTGGRIINCCSFWNVDIHVHYPPIGCVNFQLLDLDLSAICLHSRNDNHA